MVEEQENFIFDRFLRLDSRDRAVLSGGILSPVYDFIYQHPSQSNQVSYIALYNAVFDNQIANINQYNNVFTLTANLVVTTVTIPVGFYTIPNLITAISTQITGAGYTITQDPLTKLVTVANGTYPFKWENTYGGIQQFILLDMLGFNVYPLTFGSSYTAVDVPTPYYTRYVDIQSSRITAYTLSDESSGNLSRNVVCRIFLNTQDPVINFENRLLYKFHFEPSANIGLIDMQLIDEWGLPLKNMSGDFVLTFMMFKKSTKSRSVFQL